jgi:SAM-dependent methyltransferase
MLDPPRHCRCGAGIEPTRLFEIASRTSAARTMLLRCDACGSLFPEALPTTTEPERQYDVAPRARSTGRRLARALADLTRRAYVGRALPASARRVLDFGCGAGAYLASVAARGRETFGVDPVTPDEVAETWRWISEGDLERFAPFDWITLGHVIEHLDAPAHVLSRLVATLAPGGGLWLATPNADSFIFRFAGAAARDVDYPRHREIFSRDGLERRLRAAGLCVTWLSAPRLNAVLNVATTAGQIGPRRPMVLARLWLALTAHLLKPRRFRDAESPELVAVCRIRPAAPSSVR